MNPVSPPRFEGPLPTHQVLRKLIELRVARGLSRDKLAHRIGCSHMDIIRYEKNGVQPRAWTFLAWCEALGVELKWPDDND